MSGRRAPCTFRQTDVTRALRAARAAGFERVRVEIDPAGNIAIVAQANDAPSRDETEGTNEWDRIQ
jgi:hypothetical protein